MLIQKNSNLLSVPFHVLSTLALSSLLNGQVGVADHVDINLLTVSVATTSHKWIKVAWSRVEIISSDTLTVPPVISSVTLTEPPLTVSIPGTASEALVVVVVVVVVGVEAPAVCEHPVLHVAMIHSHGESSACHTKSCSS